MKNREETGVLHGQSATRDEMAQVQAQAEGSGRDAFCGATYPKLTPAAAAEAAATLAAEMDREDAAMLHRAAGGLPSPQSTEEDEDNPNSPLSVQEKKRKRLADQHNKSEQRRRRKINSKLDELQSMVPFSRSREKAAILQDVIEYIKSVQAQLHIMSAITACDYAAYRAPPPEAYLQPLSMHGPTIPPMSPVSPTPLLPPSMAAGRAPFGCCYGSAAASMLGFGVGALSSGSGEDGEVETAPPTNRGGSGGWSLSSGESSPQLGAVVDTAANAYGPVIF